MIKIMIGIIICIIIISAIEIIFNINLGGIARFAGQLIGLVLLVKGVAWLFTRKKKDNQPDIPRLLKDGK